MLALYRCVHLNGSASFNSPAKSTKLSRMMNRSRFYESLQKLFPDLCCARIKLWNGYEPLPKSPGKQRFNLLNSPPVTISSNRRNVVKINYSRKPCRGIFNVSFQDGLYNIFLKNFLPFHKSNVNEDTSIRNHFQFPKVSTLGNQLELSKNIFESNDYFCYK